MIHHDEPWIQIAFLDDQNQIYFTAEYLEIMGDLGWEAKAFAGLLLGLWYDPFEHMLDYSSGEASFSADQPGTFDRNDLHEAQEVVEYWAETWSRNGKFHEPAHKAGTGLDLDVEWYRDILRAKLVSIRLPKRLLVAYKEQVLAALDFVDSVKTSEAEEVKDGSTASSESLDFFSFAGLWQDREVTLESIRQKAWPRQHS
jgi:hypothetical protein